MNWSKDNVLSAGYEHCVEKHDCSGWYFSNPSDGFIKKSHSGYLRNSERCTEAYRLRSSMTWNKGKVLMLSTSTTWQRIENDGPGYSPRCAVLAWAATETSGNMGNSNYIREIFSPWGWSNTSRFLREVVDIQSEPLRNLVSVGTAALVGLQGSLLTEATLWTCEIIL